jgi:DNA-directed RNA polymerase specialized sigma24 family protein
VARDPQKPSTPAEPSDPSVADKAIADPHPTAAQAVPQPAAAPESETHIARETLRFLFSDRKGEGMRFIRAVVRKKLRTNQPDVDKIEKELIDTLTTSAQNRAMELEYPPWTTFGIRGWVKRLTHRTIADYFRSRKIEEKYLARDVEPDEVPSGYHAFPPTDYEASAYLVCKFMEPLVGPDPTRQQTFRMMCELELHGFSIKDLAKKYDLTPNVVSVRIYKLRKELGPKITWMDKEKERKRAIICLLVLFGVGALVAAWYVLSAPARHPAHRPVEQVVPTATVRPPTPTFNQASPTPTPSAAPSATPPEDNPEDHAKSPPRGNRPQR